MINTEKLNNWYNAQAPLYHFWRDRYDGGLVREVARLMQGAPPKSVLDAGCGTGLFSIGLARVFPECSFVGVDRSGGMIEVARKQAQKLKIDNAKFELADVETLRFEPASFDAVTAAGLFCNLDDPVPALKEFARVLKSGARAFIVEFDRRGMTLGTRIFFNTMIAGYKLVSSVFEKFRFADAWDIEKSTIDEDGFKRALAATGFVVESINRRDSHLIFVCRKP
jgi:ubiquinone/menaquinone biosynthesis C-methylase UbiE